MKTGSTFILLVNLKVEMSYVNSVIFTIKNRDTILTKENAIYDAENEQFKIELTQEDTVLLEGRCLVEAQINFSDKHVAKSVIGVFNMNPTLATRIIDGNKGTTDGEEVDLSIDGEVIYVNGSGGGGSYELPIATPTKLGGVMPAEKTKEMTEPVGVDAFGRLFSKQTIPEKEIFQAEYGVTTFADIKSAYESGKYIVCKNGEFIAPLTKITISTSNPNEPSIANFIFATMVNGTHYFYNLKKLNSKWTTIESDIPTKVSDLQNDSGFTTLEMAKNYFYLKDQTYNKAEIDAKFDELPSVPTKTSDLQNDSDFVTSEYSYSKQQIDTMFGSYVDEVAELVDENLALLGGGDSE